MEHMKMVSNVMENEKRGGENAAAIDRVDGLITRLSTRLHGLESAVFGELIMYQGRKCRARKLQDQQGYLIKALSGETVHHVSTVEGEKLGLDEDGRQSA